MHGPSLYVVLIACTP
jgi:hypothetical protein